MVIVLMGVSGVGKTTVGQELAAALGWRFVDGDDFHSRANIEKMAHGTPLDEDDRRPWLAALARAVDDWIETGQDVVLACSALRRSHRRVLRGRRDGGVRFVHLDVPADVLAARLRDRPGHFMPRALLESQLAALEPPVEALSVDGSARPEVVARRIMDALGPSRARDAEPRGVR
jgi:gluconokinase